MKPPKKNLVITLDEWQQAVQEAENAHEQVVPKDWITTIEFTERIQKSYSHASKVMRALVRSGKAESKKFVIRSGNRLIPVPHYRLLKKK